MMFFCHDHYCWEVRRVCSFFTKDLIQLNKSNPDEVNNVGNIALKTKQKKDPKRPEILNGTRCILFAECTDVNEATNIGLEMK